MAAPTFRASAVYNSGGSAVLTVVLPKPTGTASGDVLIAVAAFAFGLNTGGFTISPPSGWTQLEANTASLFGGPYEQSEGLFYKIAGGSEPSSYTFTLNSSGDDAYALGVIHAWQGGDVPEDSAVVRTAATSGLRDIHTPDVTGLDADRADVRFSLAGLGPSVTAVTATYTLHQSEHQASLNVVLASQSKSQSAGGSYGDQVMRTGTAVDGNQLGFSVVIPPADTSEALDVPFLSSSTSLYTPTLTALASALNVPFLAAATSLYTPTLSRSGLGVQPQGVSISFDDSTLEAAPVWTRIDA